MQFYCKIKYFSSKRQKSIIDSIKNYRKKLLWHASKWLRWQNELRIGLKLLLNFSHFQLCMNLGQLIGNSIEIPFQIQLFMCNMIELAVLMLYRFLNGFYKSITVAGVWFGSFCIWQFSNSYNSHKLVVSLSHCSISINEI